mmetsp:Transcript_7521/g.15601  ORF Transcript_7521/g.15601 Transcript_7521/m.15601 type:complete len:114 (+) Transcript_7521:1202-1543(+)
MYRSIVSEIGGDAEELMLTLLLTSLFSLGGICAKTAQKSKINGATTKKATATLKSNQTKLRTQGSLAVLRGANTVSGLQSIFNAEAVTSFVFAIVVGAARNNVLVVVGAVNIR